MDGLSHSAELDEIAREVRVCARCPLAAHRIHAVPGEGPAHARVMLIGEAPGAAEDREGRPFVGRAGAILDQGLEQAGLDRGDLFVTNLVKCRPPGNRVPSRGEIATCVDAYLFRQIRCVDPDIVCLLGRTAARALLGVTRLDTVRGRLVVRDRRYFVTYHPAAAGRNAAWRRSFQEDLRRLRRFVRRAGDGA